MAQASYCGRFGESVLRFCWVADVVDKSTWLHVDEQECNDSKSPRSYIVHRTSYLGYIMPDSITNLIQAHAF